MTMTPVSHPADERLAALADADRDAVADRDLREHVAGCGRCSGIVGDLGTLRSMLAELPDIPPSRPLRLLPPAPEAAPITARLPWLRRLAGPTIAAGIGLVLVGSVGSAGLLGGFSGAALSPEAAGGSPRASEVGQPAAYGTNDSAGRGESSAEDLGSPAAPAPSTLEPGATRVPAFVPDGEDNKSSSPEPVSTPSPAPITPWLAVLSVGAALVLGGLALRFSLQPRAG